MNIAVEMHVAAFLSYSSVLWGFPLKMLWKARAEPANIYAGGPAAKSKGLKKKKKSTVRSQRHLPAGTWRRGIVAWCPVRRCTGPVTRGGSD